MGCQFHFNCGRHPIFVIVHSSIEILLMCFYRHLAWTIEFPYGKLKLQILTNEVKMHGRNTRIRRI